MQHGGEPEEASGGAEDRGASAPLDLVSVGLTLPHEGGDQLHARRIDALDGRDVQSYR